MFVEKGRKILFWTSLTFGVLMILFGVFAEVDEFRHPITPFMDPGMNDFPVSSSMFIWIGFLSCLSGIISKYLINK